MAESSGRLLPQITESNEFFWKSGADGKLRFQRCAACGELRHPPGAGLPVLPLHRVGARRGVGPRRDRRLHRQRADWIPSFPPPYVIAIVAIDEDDRVRLTTNIVNCDPADVHVGMQVQVLFEHDDDVWIPLFEPTGDPEKGPFPADGPQDPRRPADAEARRQVRGQGRHHRHRHVAGRPAAHGRPARADGRGRRRRRSPTPASQPEDIDGLSTYPGPAIGGGHVGGRHHRGRGGPAAAAVVDQRRHRAPGPGRCGDRGDARGGGRVVQPRAVLPHGVGVDATPPAASGEAARRASSNMIGAERVAPDRW